MASAQPSGASSARREAILQAALGVFLRYGYKKTSMDDLARAAGMSRQGLYLNFATKDVLFKESVTYLITQSRAAARAALARTDLAIEDRLLGAFLALKLNSDGSEMSQEHMAELFATAVQLVGSVINEFEHALVADLAEALESSGVAAHWKGAGLTAHDLAQHLYAASHGIKHSVKTTDEYKARMRVAVHLVCRTSAQSQHTATVSLP